jgi:NADH-quinone oxidoreductase subunit L
MGAEQAWILAAVPAGMFLVLAFFGRWLPRQGDYLGVAAIDPSFVLFFFVLGDFLGTGDKLGPFVESIEWTQIGDFQLEMGIFVDPITIVRLGVVTSVALMVNIFSVAYMKGEPRYFWFFAVLQLFAASMILLVLADNLLLVYVAWELVGVSSFLLIGFYWERRSAVEAAKKAFITQDAPIDTRSRRSASVAKWESSVVVHVNNRCAREISPVRCARCNV